MGSIKRFDLEKLIKDYSIENYVETGIGDLTSFNFAHNFNFKRMYGVDLDEDLYKNAKKVFANSDKSVILVNDYSTNFLENISKEINGNTIWFLDAHLPYADYHKISYEQSLKDFGKNALPLEQELSILFSNRDLSKDVVIIDDWILYDPYQDYATIREGNDWRYRKLQEELNLVTTKDQILPFFKESEYNIDLQDQGYLVKLPSK